MTRRMLASAAMVAAGVVTVAYGRSYSAVAATTVDAPDQDAVVLEANGWFCTAGARVVGAGTTANRPTTGLYVGAMYQDSTLAYPVVYDGALWRNTSTGAAV